MIYPEIANFTSKSQVLLMKSQLDQITFSILTGFITGSLLWIWPWKKTNIIDESSTSLLNQLSYPNFESSADFYAIIIIILGAITIRILEKFAKKDEHV